MQPATEDGHNIMFDNEQFCVVGIMYAGKTGYELVRKEEGQEIFLHGVMAEAFGWQLNVWQDKTPTEDEVCSVLESYLSLGTYPLVMH